MVDKAKNFNEYFDRVIKDYSLGDVKSERDMANIFDLYIPK